MTPHETIDDFLAQKRMAMVGISRKPADFSRSLFRELRRRGYDVVPVNPGVKEVEGQPCCARVQEITPPVDGALLMTTSATTEQVVRDCAEAGITRIWMYRAGGAGAVSRNAIQFCEARGIRVVPGECPYMFLPETGFVHRAHGFVRKIFGRYPR